MKPITSISLISQSDDTIGDDIKIDTTAKINENEDLVIDGYDRGERVKRFWGDWDYEYWTTIKKEYKDTILLLLIKKNFKDDLELRAWLDKKKIPYDFFSWT